MLSTQWLKLAHLFYVGHVAYLSWRLAIRNVVARLLLDQFHSLVTMAFS